MCMRYIRVVCLCLKLEDVVEFVTEGNHEVNEEFLVAFHHIDGGS